MGNDRKMRISILQTSPVFGDIETNLKAIEAMWPEHSDLVLLPELCTTGYQFRTRDEAFDLSEDAYSGRSVNFLRNLAVKSDAVVAAGLAERHGERIYNSAVMVNGEGTMAVYHKLNLFYRENEFFSPGMEAPPVVDTGRGRIGMMICFDWIFPEVSRWLACSGAQVIAHPSNLVLPWCQDAMVTRSIENRVFTATANRTGSESRWPGETLDFTGGSQVTDPQGKRLVRAANDKVGVINTEIDPFEADNKAVNRNNDLMNMVQNSKLMSACGGMRKKSRN